MVTPTPPPDATDLDRLREELADGVPEWCGLVPEEQGWLADALLSGPLAPLLDELRRLRAVEAAVEGLREKWRYKGEYGWGPWQAGEGPDIEGQILDDAAHDLRAALAAGTDGAT